MHMSDELIALVDVGKTHSKLNIVNAKTGTVCWSAERALAGINGPYGRQLDVEGIEKWVCSKLNGVPERGAIRAVVPIAHGAAAVLIDDQGGVLAAPDYEDPAFEEVSESYRTVRDSFADTYSPFLPFGLNLGRQLHWLQIRFPTLVERCSSILLYPQYWAWRLSGVLASEVTSLGCHSDLWRPLEARFSNLANRQGWARKIPTLRKAADALGPLRTHIARETGLDPACRVMCGIHDSNASYLTHLIGREQGPPFAVVSSGTWTVIMAHGTELTRLQESRDMLANIDAFGVPVATARFPGGREYAALIGPPGGPTAPLRHALAAVLRRRAMALPSFATGGPFADRPGQLLNATGLRDAERVSLASLYLALMTDLVLDLLGARGSLMIDGPLAANTLYCRILSTLRREASVTMSESRVGSIAAAQYLCGYVPRPWSNTADTAKPLDLSLNSYRDEWRSRLGISQAATLLDFDQ